MTSKLCREFEIFCREEYGTKRKIIKSLEVILRRILDQSHIVVIAEALEILKERDHCFSAEDEREKSISIV